MNVRAPDIRRVAPAANVLRADTRGAAVAVQSWLRAANNRRSAKTNPAADDAKGTKPKQIWGGLVQLEKK
jgi:hypothetical protein